MNSELPSRHTATALPESSTATCGSCAFCPQISEPAAQPPGGWVSTLPFSERFCVLVCVSVFDSTAGFAGTVFPPPPELVYVSVLIPPSPSVYVLTRYCPATCSYVKRTVLPSDCR